MASLQASSARIIKTLFVKVCMLILCCGLFCFLGKVNAMFLLIYNVYCIVCSPCPLGTYISSPCTSTSDTVCTECDVCNNMQFESQTCSRGRNTVCNSCEKCVLSKTEKANCKDGLYYWWFLENCCFDSNGNKVRCPDLTKTNMLITAGTSRIDMN